MKHNIRIILISSAAAIVFAAICFGLIAAGGKRDRGQCRQLNVHINDKEQRYFITEQEIANSLSQQGLHPAGRNMEEINTQLIEDAVRTNEMVRSAECYKTRHGDIVIELTQRIPLLRVITPTESYFIDTDRKRMPVRASIDCKVMTVNGHVGLQMAQNEIADFVVWLQQNTYWQKRITQIQVKEGKQFVLKQGSGEPLILLGELDGYKQKLKRLRIFNEQEEKGTDIPAYKEMDLRYKGQVIGRYKQN